MPSFFRWGSWKALRNTSAWSAPQEARTCWWVTDTPHDKSPGALSPLFFKWVNTLSLVGVAAWKPRHSWSHGRVKRYSAQPWREGQSGDGRKLDKQGDWGRGRKAPSLSVFFVLSWCLRGKRGRMRVLFQAGWLQGGSSSSCYYWCGLILPRVAPSASEIVIWAAPATRQPTVEAQPHPW